MPTVVIGQRTTNQTATEVRAERHVGRGIRLLEPDEAPLITILGEVKPKRKSVDQTKFEWIQDDYCNLWAQNSNSEVAADGTTLTLVDSTKVVPGELLYVPKANNSSYPGEVVLVTAVNRTTHACTIVRNIGAVTNAAAVIPANAPVRIISSAREEGGTLPTAKMTQKVTLFNYTQILTDALDHTNTEIAIRKLGIDSPERNFEINKKMKEHKIQMNSVLMFGARSEDLTGGPNGKPLRTTGGINYWITSNVVDGGGVLSRKTWLAFCRSAFRYGSKKKLLVCAPIIKEALSEWLRSHVTAMPKDESYGVTANRAITPYGEFMVVNDWMLENGPGDALGMAGWAFALDPKEIEIRPLINNGENRDTKVQYDVVKDGSDRKVDKILTEFGVEFRQEKYHAKLYNVNSYMS